MAEAKAPDPTREAPPEPPVSYQEFLDWADEDVRAEWIDGEIHLMSPASDRHQDISRFLTSLLSLFVEGGTASALVRPAPFQMKLERGREPDLLVIRDEHRDRIRESYLEGPADLAVEIVSSESAARDRGEKFSEYEDGGVEEYWIIDPIREQLEVYHLEDGRYRGIFLGQDGRAESVVLDGLWVKAEWFWQDPLPRVMDVASEVGIV
jgi:Uma2 family endonuclease